MSTTQFAHPPSWVSVTCISCISLIKNVSLWQVHVLFSQKLLNAIHVMHTRTKHQQLLSVFTGHAMGTIRQFLWCYFLRCSQKDRRLLLKIVVGDKLVTRKCVYFWYQWLCLFSDFWLRNVFIWIQVQNFTHVRLNTFVAATLDQLDSNVVPLRRYLPDQLMLTTAICSSLYFQSGNSCF